MFNHIAATCQCATVRWLRSGSTKKDFLKQLPLTQTQLLSTAVVHRPYILDISPTTPKWN